MSAKDSRSLPWISFARPITLNGLWSSRPLPVNDGLAATHSQTQVRIPLA